MRTGVAGRGNEVRPKDDGGSGHEEEINSAETCLRGWPTPRWLAMSF